jgi:hypothetical protein
MALFSVSIIYDNELNAIITTVNFLSDSLHDYECVFDDLRRKIHENSQTKKIWMLADYSRMQGTTSVTTALIARKAFRKFGKEINDSVIERIVITKGNLAAMLYVTLFNAFLGTKAKVFDSLEKAKAYILANQTRNQLAGTSKKQR